MTPALPPGGSGRAVSDRRRLVAVFPLAAALASLWPRSARAAPLGLAAPDSLAQELTSALGSGRPLVVMVSLPGCPYCKIVRESHLVPLRRDTGQPVVQIDMGSQVAVRDFQGGLTTHADLVRGWKVKSAPTVLFFGKGGREAAPRLVGASIPDFYGSYLEQRLRDAASGLT